MWRNGRETSDRVDATIAVRQVYAGSTVPSMFGINIPSLGNFVLTTQASEIPQTPDFNGAGFLAPCYVSHNGTLLPAAAAVVAWFPGDLFPQETDMVKIAEVRGIQKSWRANRTAQAAFVLIIVCVLFLYTAIIMGLASVVMPGSVSVAVPNVRTRAKHGKHAVHANR